MLALFIKYKLVENVRFAIKNCNNIDNGIFDIIEGRLFLSYQKIVYVREKANENTLFEIKEFSRIQR